MSIGKCELLNYSRDFVMVEKQHEKPIKEDDFEVIVDNAELNSSSQTIREFNSLPKETRDLISKKVEKAMQKKVVEFFDSQNVSNVNYGYLKVAVPIGILFYTGPLSAIFTRVVMDTTEGLFIVKKALESLQYFPEEEIQERILIEEMKPEQRRKAKEVFYKISGEIPKDSEDAHRIYRKMSLKFHPDKNPDREENEKILEISEAFELLKKYDSPKKI
jgi:hypothetical protein